MNKPLPPEVQRRLRALYHYVTAMESGDLESIASLLRAAEQDAVLDRMFQEIDMHYQDQMVVQPGELAAVHELTEQLFMQELERVQALQNGKQKQTRKIKPVFKLSQERVQETMKYRPKPFIDEVEIDDMPRAQRSDPKPRRKRYAHLLQMVAAVLLVGGLLAAFLLLFASRSQSHNSQVASHIQTQPSGIFIAVSRTWGNSPSATFRAYGLRATSNTPIWSTSLAQAAYVAPSSIVIQGQVAYISITNNVFALQTDNGKLLWRQTMPSSALSNLTLQVKGDILIASGQDTNYIASLYRLKELDGSVLWHYQTGGDTAFAIDNGIIYTGKDEGADVFTPDPGAMRSLVALNATNGNVIWSHSNVYPLGITAQNGTLYVQNMAAGNVGSDKRYFLSVWTSNGKQLWSKIGPMQEPMPVAIDGSLFVIDIGGNLCAYRTGNGQQVWCTHNPTQTFPSGNKTITEDLSYASCVPQNGVLYATYSTSIVNTSTQQESNASFLQALNIQTGTVIWTHKVGSSNSSGTHREDVGPQFDTLNHNPILLSQNALSIVSGASIYTFSLADGQQLWQSTITKANDQVDFVSSAYTPTHA